MYIYFTCIDEDFAINKVKKHDLFPVYFTRIYIDSAINKVEKQDLFAVSFTRIYIDFAINRLEKYTAKNAEYVGRPMIIYS